MLVLQKSIMELRKIKHTLRKLEVFASFKAEIIIFRMFDNFITLLSLNYNFFLKISE